MHKHKICVVSNHRVAVEKWEYSKTSIYLTPQKHLSLFINSLWRGCSVIAVKENYWTIILEVDETEIFTSDYLCMPRTSGAKLYANSYVGIA